MNEVLIITEDFVNGKSVIGVTDKMVSQIVIPTGVETIGEKAFENCIHLKSVDIPLSVTSIGNDAFSGCSSLLEIDIPNSIKSIGKGAFSGCKSLQTIDIPESVTSIGDLAFCECSLLKAFVIPNGIKSINNGCFCHCKSLEYVRIPGTITSIEDYAFYGCASLRDLVIPNSVRTIGDHAFGNCIWLCIVNIPDGVVRIGKGAFIDCQGLYNAFLPKSLIAIEDYAFNGTSIRQIHIPQNVEVIGNHALDSIFLEDISVDAQNNNYKSIDGILYNKNGDTIIKVPYNLYKPFFTISNEVKYIGANAFFLTSILQIEIPDSIIKINTGAFQSRNIKAIYSDIRDLGKVEIASDSFSDTECEDFEKGIDLNSCILYIPSGTRWAYKHHPVFGKFANIEVE